MRKIKGSNYLLGNEQYMEFHPIEWVLLETLKASNAEPIRGKVLFQKILFMFLQNYPNWYSLADFRPHILGPYSEPVHITLEDLTDIGLVIGNKTQFVNPDLTTYMKRIAKNEFIFELSPSGLSDLDNFD